MKKTKLEELGRLELHEFKKAAKLPVTIVLDNIRSGMNVGSVFRTADAFAIQHICLCGITAIPPHREILKTAIGAENSVNWNYEKSIRDCIRRLKTDEYVICAIEQTDQSVFLQDYEVDLGKKYALVFGNEVNGVSESILPDLDVAVEIPQFGTKHSLNISVCAGIVTWHFWKRLKPN